MFYEFVYGLIVGACIAAGGIGYYAQCTDATPVYNAGYEDGFTAGIIAADSPAMYQAGFEADQ